MSVSDGEVMTVSVVADDLSIGWQPYIGPEATSFLTTRVPESSRAAVRRSSAAILAKGIAPSAEPDQETGLIVGYVQSGKTMSFETVTALARDNGFQIVIVIAGTATALLEQSTGRLRRDLGLDDLSRGRRWVQFTNPIADDSTREAIRDVLDDWQELDEESFRPPTVLITVLKHHQRLYNLAQLMASISLKCVPVLIVDDEADQASLNNEAGQGTESTTYRRLMQLRQSVPMHTYLQYTATPQAPLLVSIIDSLSPNFVEVLEPGEEYVGGREFFDNGGRYVQVIPSNDVPTTSNVLHEPPTSLLAALRVFMLGVAAGVRQSSGIGNRSMLVHPSHRTAQHQNYYGWVREIIGEWKRILRLSDTDPDREELVDDFRVAYDDLSSTVGEEIPTFDELVGSLLRAFRQTRVLEVNARRGTTPEVEWRNAYGWILVGGQAMDRGFTIEGLTVTYMPRGIGVGNADTVQQRARFFGYKRPYLGYCRLYLEEGTLHAFRAYIDHEEDIRGQLERVESEGLQLDEWKRAFVLDPSLRPCRTHVLEFDYMRGSYADSWVVARMVREPGNVLESNRHVASSFLAKMVLVEDEGHPDRTEAQRHLVCKDVALQRAMEDLLVKIRITGWTDSQRNTGLLLQLSKALEESPTETCRVYSISPDVRRRRRIGENGELSNLFQGEFPVNPREHRGTIYPGDRMIRHHDQVTIQIHRLDLTMDDEVVETDVTVVAVWIPARLARAWLVQD